MKYKNFGKYILSLCFLAAIGIFCMLKGRNIWLLIRNDLTLPDQIEKRLIDGNGAVAKMLHMRGYYSDLGIYITDDLSIISKSDQTTTDYEYQQMCQFKDFLDQQDIQLLYVNAPVKYLDDSVFQKEFGLDSYSNQNSDKLLSRMKDADIECLDLREEIKQDHMEISQMFYRTDHHWTTRSGFWATRKIAETLNDKFGYHIDMALYDESQYRITEYSQKWLGEQGRKIALSYAGLDDYTFMEPKFSTDLTFYNKDQKQEGDFGILVDKTRLNSDQDVYDAQSLHYTYLPGVTSTAEIQNHKKKSGRVLLLADSYMHVVMPFLSLGVSDLSMCAPRYYRGVRKLIKERKVDTVVILYAQFMIGAHDDPDSANYNQFTFD